MARLLYNDHGANPPDELSLFDTEDGQSSGGEYDEPEVIELSSLNETSPILTTFLEHAPRVQYSCYGSANQPNLSANLSANLNALDTSLVNTLQRRSRPGCPTEFHSVRPQGKGVCGGLCTQCCSSTHRYWQHSNGSYGEAR